MNTSPLDQEFIRMGREHIAKAMRWTPMQGAVLEIGPPADRRKSAVAQWYTLDLTEGCDFLGDITKRTEFPDSRFDAVLCLDVLEHTLNPFAAISELRRILKPGGWLIASAPFNVRRHGPLPDCWRFGIDGWRALLRDWDDLELDVLETPHRPLAPIHINARARCNKTKEVRDDELEFFRI